MVDADSADTVRIDESLLRNERIQNSSMTIIKQLQHECQQLRDEIERTSKKMRDNEMEMEHAITQTRSNDRDRLLRGRLELHYRYQHSLEDLREKLRLGEKQLAKSTEELHKSLLESKKSRIDRKKIEKDAGFNFFTGTKQIVTEAHSLWKAFDSSSIEHINAEVAQDEKMKGRTVRKSFHDIVLLSRQRLQNFRDRVDSWCQLFRVLCGQVS